MPGLREGSPLTGPQMEEGRLVGMDEEGRSGTYWQADDSALISRHESDGLVVMPISAALDKYGQWLGARLWSLLSPDKDEYTREAADGPLSGYFIRSQAGARITEPVQACLSICTDGLRQRVHNVVVASEGSEMHIVTGCFSSASVEKGMHIGVSEFFVEKGATLSFTMIHRWGAGLVVMPRSMAVVEEGGVFVSNFICLHPAARLQMYPGVICRGSGARVRMNSVIRAGAGADMDVGSEVRLEAEGSRAEIVSRAISGGGSIKARGRIVGAADGVRGHLECRGLMLGQGGSIYAVPEIDARTAGAEISHEAAVGRIAQDELEYLMARGLSPEEAVSAIVRGFMDIDIHGLPEPLAIEIKRAVDAAGDLGG